MASKKKTSDEIVPPTEPPEEGALELPDTAVATMVSHVERPPEPEDPGEQLGLDLLPDTTETGVVEQTRWYWCGLFPTINRAEVSVAGVSFVRTHEIVSKRDDSGKSKRTPYIGQCHFLTKAQVMAIRERLRYSVYRFTEEPKDILTVGEGIEALEQEPRKGVPIRIMTKEENKMRVEAGGSPRTYQPQQWDEPLAYHIFIVPCENQERPRGGVEYPPSVVTTGLRWIGDD